MKSTLQFLFVFLSVNLFGQTFGDGVTDIDGNLYESVIIGDQEWMAENLRVSRYSNGDSIPYIPEDSLWHFVQIDGGPLPISSGGAYCYYDLELINSTSYNSFCGKLYNGFVANDSRGVCPIGWEVPSRENYTELSNYLVGDDIAGGKLKSTDDLWWENIGATNETGFSALPCGLRTVYSPSVPNLEIYSLFLEATWFWTSTSTEWTENGSYNRAVPGSQPFFVDQHFSKGMGFSIRCLKSTSESQVQELITIPKKLIKILDLMGRETSFKPNTPLIYVYDDGSTEKVFSVKY